VDYHQPIKIGETVYYFGHLNPFEHTFFSEKAKKQLLVEVKFSNHCFTQACDYPGKDDLVIKDQGNRNRLFCAIRYQASTQLPQIVRDMLEDNLKVWQTTQLRNWVHTITIDTPEGPYYVFFEVRKAGKTESPDIKIYVESAYPQGPDKDPPSVHGNMRIETLCTNTYLGKPVATKR